MQRKWPIVALVMLGACSRASVPPRASAPAVRPPTTDQVVQSATQEVRPAVKADSTRPSDTVSVSAIEVAQRLTEVFGDSAANLSTADSLDADAPSWDIEVRSYESTDRVEHYVRMFSGPARERIAAHLQKGTRFEPMIRAKLREGGLPEDMYYLALVESGFEPHAYSKAAAVGMWQFMTSTARGMGMRVDWWVDERRDPIRSTIGAVRFLHGLRQQFGSMYLAAAAYNGGPGRIARGLSRYADDLEGTTGEDLFFALAEKDYLKNETREYVPQLIAVALIAKDPRKYGLELDSLPPFEYDSVRVAPLTPLAAIARASGATVKQIQELNPHILRGMTPPKTPMQVRVPVGAAVSFDSAFAELPPADLVATRKTVSKKGERLVDVARRMKVTTQNLKDFNQRLEIAKSGRLVAGQTILVPMPAVAAAAIRVPNPDIEKYPSSGRTRVHVVKRGESLGLIAKRYKTTTAALMRLNRMKRDMIFAGQTLIVSGTPRKR